MRIFTKKSLQFDDPAGEQPAVSVQHQSFADVPDWVVGSAMFKLASADGDVEVIGGKADEKAAETGTKGKTKAEKEAEAKAKAEAEAMAKAEEEAKAQAEAEAKAKAEAQAAGQQ